MHEQMLKAQAPASYGNHPPHMAFTRLIWQPPASYGRRPSARSRRGSTSRAASTSPPPTCHRGASRTVAHVSESGCRCLSYNVSSLPHGHRPRVSPALPLRNDFNCYYVTTVPPVPSAGTAGRPRPARRAARWRRRPGSAPSCHVSTRCRDTAEMQPRYTRDGSSSKTTGSRRDVAYPQQEQHARLRRCHVRSPTPPPSTSTRPRTCGSRARCPSRARSRAPPPPRRSRAAASRLAARRRRRGSGRRRHAGSWSRRQCRLGAPRRPGLTITTRLPCDHITAGAASAITSRAP